MFFKHISSVMYIVHLYAIAILFHAGPNGDVRQIIGEFQGKNLSELRGGEIIVETDGSGIPNGRSAAILGHHLTSLAENSTFAPLHIPRRDNELFLQKHGQMITDVEVKKL